MTPRGLDLSAQARRAAALVSVMPFPQVVDTNPPERIIKRAKRKSMDEEPGNGAAMLGPTSHSP